MRFSQAPQVKGVTNSYNVNRFLAILLALVSLSSYCSGIRREEDVKFQITAVHHLLGSLWLILNGYLGKPGIARAENRSSVDNELMDVEYSLGMHRTVNGHIWRDNRANE